ncbi:MAG: HEPN domain-containing protein [Clostridia bacterium]|nr:HEPN domain-containing protein [Clostridia bacterium]
MKDNSFIEECLDHAMRNLKSAKVLLQNDCGNDYVAFHCQQAIEKALKALILYLFATLESGHSLLYLCKKVMEKEPSFKDVFEKCLFVNQYYIETRYPNENQVKVTEEEAKRCIEIAEEVLEKVLKCIN